MTNIILCDLNVENIKIIMEHISSYKNKKIKYIASTLEEICFHFLSNTNYIFAINTDCFPEENLDLINDFQNNSLIFYSSKMIEDPNFLSIFENHKYKDFSKSYLIKKFKSLNFDFSQHGTIYLIDFIELFSNIFHKDSHSFKYIFPYIALKYNTSPEIIFLSILISLENMYSCNNCSSISKDFSNHYSLDYIDFPFFKNVFYNFMSFLYK